MRTTCHSLIHNCDLETHQTREHTVARIKLLVLLEDHFQFTLTVQINRLSHFTVTEHSNHTPPGECEHHSANSQSLQTRPPHRMSARYARRIVSSCSIPFDTQPQFERASCNPRFSIYVRSLPRARCLTLTLPPNGGGPGRHSGARTRTYGGPFATRARDSTRHHVRTRLFQFTRSGCLIMRAGQASKNR